MESYLQTKYLPEEKAFDSMPISRALVNLRTHEIALHAGRKPPLIIQSDYEQAKREITGESDPDRQLELLEACG